MSTTQRQKMIMERGTLLETKGAMEFTQVSLLRPQTRTLVVRSRNREMSLTCQSQGKGGRTIKKISKDHRKREETKWTSIHHFSRACEMLLQLSLLRPRAMGIGVWA